jgi:hypothetical protein
MEPGAAPRGSPVFPRTGLIRQHETSRAGRGPGACPRAWPVPGRPGWCGPRDEVLRQRLRRRQGSGPGISVGQQPRRVPHREVPRRHPVQPVPGHRERDRHAGARSRAVGSHHGRAVRPGRVDEHHAAAIGLDERRRREAGIQPRGPLRQGAGRSRRVVGRHRFLNGHVDMHALGPAGLDRARQTRPGQRFPDQPGRGHRLPELARSRRIDVEHQVGGPVQVLGGAQRDVVLHRALIGEPGQRRLVLTQRIPHLPVRRFRPHRDGLDPWRRVVRHVLLHERTLARAHPDHRQRPAAQHGDHTVRDRLQVVHQIALGRVRPVEQRLVQVRQRDLGRCHA